MEVVRRTRGTKKAKDGGSDVRARARTAVKARLELEERCRVVWNRLMFSDRVEPEELRRAAASMQRQHYDGVVEERSIARRCGYPLCAGALGKRRTLVLQRQRALEDYCSKRCYVASQFLRSQLSDEPLYLRGPDAAANVTLLSDGEMDRLAQALSESMRVVTEGRAALRSELPEGAAAAPISIVETEPAPDAVPVPPTLPPGEAPSAAAASIEGLRTTLAAAKATKRKSRRPVQHAAAQFGLYERVFLHLSGMVSQYTQAFVESGLQSMPAFPGSRASKEAMPSSDDVSKGEPDDDVDDEALVLPPVDSTGTLQQRDAIFSASLGRAFATVKQQLGVEHQVDADAQAIGRTFYLSRHVSELGPLEMQVIALVLLRVLAGLSESLTARLGGAGVPRLVDLARRLTVLPEELDILTNLFYREARQ